MPYAGVMQTLLLLLFLMSPYANVYFHTDSFSYVTCLLEAEPKVDIFK